MSELCKWCAYEHSDCKGNKGIQYNMHCQYYKKPAVFNAKEAAQQIQFLRGVLDQVEEDYFKLKAKTEWVPLKFDEYKLTTDYPESYDGKRVLVTDGKTISVERIKKDCYDHFYPNGRWFELEDVVAWMPLPEPYKGGGAE